MSRPATPPAPAQLNGIPGSNLRPAACLSTCSSTTYCLPPKPKSCPHLPQYSAPAQVPYATPFPCLSNHLTHLPIYKPNLHLAVTNQAQNFYCLRSYTFKKYPRSWKKNFPSIFLFPVLLCPPHINKADGLSLACLAPVLTMMCSCGLKPNPIVKLV